MSDRKDRFELAADITIAAMGKDTNFINTPDRIAFFYRTIYKEIATCEETPLVDLR